MTTIHLLIISVLFVSSAVSTFNVTRIRVFPAANHSIAGVMQVSYTNEQNQPQYAFNASQARNLCWFLGLNIATKSQVEQALSRGFETCRFGWIDEHCAVIPRIHAFTICGQNQTGLVEWRTSVTKMFDVFCFNESDATGQLQDTSSPRNDLEFTEAPNSTLTSQFVSSTTTAEAMIKEEEPARFVSSPHGSTGANIVLIGCTCGLLLTSIAIFVYLKVRRRWSLSSSKKQQKEYIQTEELKLAKNVSETTKAVDEQQRTEACSCED
ncbi:Lymphatic vessel endothelial hyaluronic acid receptor 1 [Oryzias melastigma]|uniref:Lymphatic vessel endothelial hyaluronic acid receptor 1 n=1 Tax=Oryzias melastigma TaxID=30732 RepID=A0A834F5T6_ORYME|nr:Lymphatic vessel endothelial hyaluronic acid receptor 1 [Oryzias melastigma]